MIGIALLLDVAAVVGISYVAGFGAVVRALERVGTGWPWLGILVLGVIVSYAGYAIVYERIFRIEGGPQLSPKQMRAVVSAGFGGFLAHGGGPLDIYALEGGGCSRREAKMRVTALGGMEHGVLALVATVAAIVTLVRGEPEPPLDVLIPWAVIPVPAFLAAFVLAHRHANPDPYTSGGGDGEHGGVRERARSLISIFVDSVEMIRRLFLDVPGRFRSVAGMAAFWLGESFAIWGAMAACGYQMAPAPLIVGVATGAVFTRRTGPFAGSGVLALVLPVTIWYSGAPLAVAVVGVGIYRACGTWIPMPWSLRSLPTLRALGQRQTPRAPGQAPQPENEPALRRSAG